MTKAVHFICVKDGQGKPKNVIFDPETKIFSSGYWDISAADAEQLINGWLYLHTTKKEMSYYGGVVTGFKRIHRDDVARTNRIALIFQPIQDARGKPWRHHDQPRAWTSGLIVVDMANEARNANSKICFEYDWR